jgi:Tfp pilus assembly protein PilF
MIARTRRLEPDSNSVAHFTPRLRIECIEIYMKFLVFQLLILGALTSGQAGAPQDADIKALFEKAQRALSAKDYPKAEEGFREVLKLNPSFTAAYVDLGVVYMRTKHFEAAVKSFERAKNSTIQN